MLWLCGGSLIAAEFVLTTGHCIVTREYGPPTKVRMGVNDLTDLTSPNKQDIKVESVIIHPEYNARSKKNDIGIVRLKKEAMFNQYVQPACLYTEKNDPQTAILTTWNVVNCE